jgi:hypothetical protein
MVLEHYESNEFALLCNLLVCEGLPGKVSAGRTRTLLRLPVSSRACARLSKWKRATARAPSTL